MTNFDPERAPYEADRPIVVTDEQFDELLNDDDQPGPTPLMMESMLQARRTFLWEEDVQAWPLTLGSRGELECDLCWQGLPVPFRASADERPLRKLTTAQEITAAVRGHIPVCEKRVEYFDELERRIRERMAAEAGE